MMRAAWQKFLEIGAILLILCAGVLLCFLGPVVFLFCWLHASVRNLPDMFRPIYQFPPESPEDDGCDLEVNHRHHFIVPTCEACGKRLRQYFDTDYEGVSSFTACPEVYALMVREKILSLNRANAVHRQTYQEGSVQN